MKKNLVALLFLLTTVPLLGGCQTTPAASLPPEAYLCKDWPVAPSGEYGLNTLSRYQSESLSAYNDCKDKLKSVNPHVKAGK